MFRRRNRRSGLEWLKASVYPKGGWLRAATYVRHRLTRLPDPPHRIARGIFAGVLVSFTPLFGLHFFAAALIAWLMRGNILAALLGTFFGNPLTLPFIVVVSVKLGHAILGSGIDAVPASQILSAYASAAAEIWVNMVAVVTKAPTDWSKVHTFYHGLFKPYLVGGIGPGLIAATVCYYLSLPLILGYQKLRQKRRRDRAERLRDRAASRLRAGAPPKDTAKDTASE